MSVKVRIVAYTIASMGVLAAVVAGVGCKLYYDNLMESYTAYAGTVLTIITTLSEKTNKRFIFISDLPYSRKHYLSNGFKYNI